MTQDITMTDMFCGAGGTSTGAVAAGASVKLAINHWARAIETHNTNHPNTAHVLTDLHKADPRRYPSTTGLAASPECTSHTLAKGHKRSGQNQPDLPGLWNVEEANLSEEAEERSRCTMWTPLDWSEYHDYQFVILENVVDAHLWRPFDSWLQAWKSLGYEYELVYFNSMFAHPTPQSRDRMYFVGWKKGNPKPNLSITPLANCVKCGKDVDSVQCWKNPGKKHGKYKQQYVYCCPACAQEVTPYYYAAANAIDWSLIAPRIGDRVKPLKVKTMQRIEDGLKKFAESNALSPAAIMVALPFLANLNHSELRPIAVGEQPFHTQTGYDSTGLVVPPFILDHTAEYRLRDMCAPLSTVCAGGNHHSLIVPAVSSWLMTYYNHGQLASTRQAAPTVTTLERHALVTSEQSSSIAVEDCGFRMLVPKEIQAAMAFPGNYILTGSRREQVKQLGNAVTPPVMQLLVERVISSLS